MNAAVENVNNGIGERSDAAWGAADIGKVLGMSQRRALYMLERGDLASTGARKVGRRWLASRRRLAEFVNG